MKRIRLFVIAVGYYLKSGYWQAYGEYHKDDNALHKAKVYEALGDASMVLANIKLR